MKELYKKIKIPNLEKVQEELHKSILHDYKSKGLHAFTYPQVMMETTCPTLMNWLVPRCRLPIRLLRYYVTPPHTSLRAHIDGGGEHPIVPFGINIPVAGAKNTWHIYYNCPKDNLTAGQPGKYLGGTHYIDRNKLTEIERFEILEPMFTNNSVMHGVENLSDDWRIMFTIRWTLDHTVGREIDQCIDTTDLFV